MLQSVERHESSLRLELLIRTQLPFAAGVVIVTLAVGFTRPSLLGHVQLIIGFALTALAVLLTCLLPWERVHEYWRLALTGLNLATVGLLLHSIGDVLNAAFLLLAFPLLWMAFSFGRVGAAAALIGAVGVIWLPDVLYGQYPANERAWSELVSLTLLTVAVISVIASQARRFKLAQLSVEQSTRERENAVREREQALHDQERAAVILRSVADEVGVALVFLDENHHVILDNRVSRELAHLAGFDLASGTLLHAYADDGVTPLPAEEQPVVRVINGETIHDFLYWLGPPGHQRATLNNGRPVIDERGNYRGAILVGHDVTDLLNATRVREESLATLSHELRTPLTAMIGHLELLEDTELPDPLRRPLQAMSRGAEQLQDLAERFLASSSPTPTPRRTELDLDAVVTRVIEQLPPPTHPAVALHLDVAPGLRVDADPQLLQQLINILLRNALAYTKEGSITLRAERHDDTVELTVTDTGIGIPAADLPRIFDRFHRGENARRSEIRGTGLGLAIARTIAHAHGGTLALDSTEGRGTRATATIPDTSSPVAQHQ